MIKKTEEEDKNHTSLTEEKMNSKRHTEEEEVGLFSEQQTACVVVYATTVFGKYCTVYCIMHKQRYSGEEE